MNTITFKAARCTDEPEPVTGDAVELVDGFWFAVYPTTQVKIPSNFAWNWYVVEISTGWGVGHGYTKEEAIQDAKSKVTKVGEEKFREMISKVPILNP